MSTPTKPKAAEIDGTPDDLLAMAEREKAADTTDAKGGESDVTANRGAEVEPAGPGGSNLPAVPDAATPVKIESNALRAFEADEWASFDDADGGLLNWQHVGFSIPRIVSDMRPGGGWTDEVTGQKWTVKEHALEVIIVAAMPNRALFVKKYGTGEKVPDCRSNDMLRADPSSPAMQAEWTPPDRDDHDGIWFTRPTGVCASCPASRWRGDDAPACGPRINMLVYLPDSGEIRRMTVGGTSVKHFRKYASSFKAKAGSKPIYAQTTVMTLDDVDNGTMRWIEAHFAAGEAVSPREAMATIKPLKDDLVAGWQSLLAESLALGEAEGEAIVGMPDAIDVEARDRYADEEPF